MSIFIPLEKPFWAENKENKLLIILFVLFLIQCIFPQAGQPQDTDPNFKVKITSPKGGIFISGENVQIKGTADLRNKEHLWLIVKQIENSHRLMIYITEVKVDPIKTTWEYTVLLDKIEQQNDASLVENQDSQQTINSLNTKPLIIMVVVVDEVQHNKLKSHLMDKLQGIKTKLVPPSIVSKDEIEINVKYK